MSRVLIVGASGQVGSALVEEYRSAGYEVFGTHNRHAPDPNFLVTSQLDLEIVAHNQDSLNSLLEACQPTIVIICSALTNVDQLENDRETANLVNVDAPRALAVAASKNNAKVVVYSTEYVWDGNNGPYAEDDPTNALNVYGWSKVEMEKAILAEVPQALILRTTVVYGPELQGKNFVYQVCRKLSAGDAMQVVNDQISTPTYNRDLASMTRMLVDVGACGLFNACGSERMPRYDFALIVAEVFGLRKELLSSITTSSSGRAQRPLSAGMKIDKLLDAIGGSYKTRTVREALRHWATDSMQYALPLECDFERVVRNDGACPSNASRT